MKKFVSPYLKKKIKIDKKKYNLEYYNCTDELMFNYLDMLDDRTRNKVLSDPNIEFTRKEIIKPNPPIDPNFDNPRQFPKIRPFDVTTTSGETWSSTTDKFFDHGDMEFDFDEW